MRAGLLGFLAAAIATCAGGAWPALAFHEGPFRGFGSWNLAGVSQGGPAEFASDVGGVGVGIESVAEVALFAEAPQGGTVELHRAQVLVRTELQNVRIDGCLRVREPVEVTSVAPGVLHVAGFVTFNVCDGQWGGHLAGTYVGGAVRLDFDRFCSARQFNC